MATVPVFTPAGERTGEIELAAEVFGIAPNASLVHQSVVATLAGMRQGTADTKTRGEVHHTTRKLFKQKGTGRARQGMRSAPHWKGGGVAFGPHPRDYSVSFPKKMRRKALLSVLSTMAAESKICVVEEFGFAEAKTKNAIALLQALGLSDKKVLIVFDEPVEIEILAFRNLPKVMLTTVEMLGTYDTLLADVLLFTRSSLAALEMVKQQPLGAARWKAQQMAEGGAA